MIKIYTDKEKISQYLDMKGISKRKFYEKTGFSSGFLDKGSSLGVDKLKIIIDNYPDFNYNSLLANEKELVKEQSSLAGDSKTVVARLNNQDREIDRLNNIIDIIITKLELEKEMRLLSPKEKG